MSTMSMAADARPTLGGRDTDERGVNAGVLRCPRCFSRLVSTCGELKERQGSEACLWVPQNRKPAAAQPTSTTVEAAEAAADHAVDEPLPACFIESNFASKAEYEASLQLPTAERAAAERAAAVAREPASNMDRPAADEWDWTETGPYTWWWMVGSMDDVDNLGLSRLVHSPRGLLKLVMCCECNYGPIGYQLEDEVTLWLACDLMHQQDPSLAKDAEDFPPPPGVSLEMLQSMIASGMAVMQFHVTFEEQVLGMCLADAPDGNGVQVVAFTQMEEGVALAAEQSGRVAVGDKLSRVNGRTTAGLGYDAVLGMVREATRPVTIHFERKGTHAADAPVERIAHQDWR